MITWLRNKLRPHPNSKELAIELTIQLACTDPPLERLTRLLSLLNNIGARPDRRELMIQRVGYIPGGFEYLTLELAEVNQYLLTANTINNLRLRFDDVISAGKNPLSEVFGNDPEGTLRLFVSRATVFTHLISNFNMEDVYPRIETMINKNIAVLEEVTLVLLRCVR